MTIEITGNIIFIVFLVILLIMKIKKDSKEMKEMKVKNTTTSKSTENKIIKQNKQEMQEMKVKANITEKKDVENKLNKLSELAKIDFSAIEYRLNKLVEIIDLPVNAEGLDTVYLVKVAGIDIRVYVSIIEANRLYRFMKNIVTDVIINGSAKVEVIQLKTNGSIYYLLKITGKNVKIYTSIQEATRVASYMTNVLNKVLNII